MTCCANVQQMEQESELVSRQSGSNKRSSGTYDTPTIAIRYNRSKIGFLLKSLFFNRFWSFNLIVHMEQKRILLCEMRANKKIVSLRNRIRFLFKCVEERVLPRSTPRPLRMTVSSECKSVLSRSAEHIQSTPTTKDGGRHPKRFISPISPAWEGAHDCVNEVVGAPWGEETCSQLPWPWAKMSFYEAWLLLQLTCCWLVDTGFIQGLIFVFHLISNTASPQKDTYKRYMAFPARRIFASWQ